MKAVILDGGRNGETTAIREWLIPELQSRTWEVQSYVLKDLTLAPCKGCFGCWIETPGECVIRDVGQEIARHVAQCYLLVYLSPVTFGGYSSELKKMMDRLIPVISPFFETYHGEIHHKQRYPRAARLLSIGVQKTADAEDAAIFTRLLERNALNLHAPAYAGGVVTPQDFQSQIKNWLPKVAAPSIFNKTQGA